MVYKLRCCEGGPFTKRCPDCPVFVAALENPKARPQCLCVCGCSDIVTARHLRKDPKRQLCKYCEIDIHEGQRR